MRLNQFNATEKWLFCSIFSAVLNVIAIAAWARMHDSGKISPAVVALTSGYLLLSLWLSLRSVRLETLAASRASQ